jgi:hypothetical protein
MKQTCDRCGKKVDDVYAIGISIADLKGKFYYCKECTCEFINKWDAFHKEPKIFGHKPRKRNGGKNGGTT